MTVPADDEIIAQQKRNIRYGVILGAVVGLLMGGLVFLAASGLRSGFLARLGMSRFVENALVYFPMIVLAGVWIFFLRQLFVAKAPPEGFSRRHVDHYQTLQRWGLLIFVFVLGIICLSHALHPQAWAFGPSSWLGATLFPLIVLFGACFVVIGTGFLNPHYRAAITDELYLTLRAKAAKAGYVLTMLLLAADNLIAGVWPGWIARAIPASIFAGFAVPALYLVWLEWRAGREQ